MGQQDQGVRIGPISLFTLVAALGMAVLAVLTISTAKAMSALSERTAMMAYEAYEAESCAQAFVAEVDESLATVRASGGDRAAALRALELALPDAVLRSAKLAGFGRDSAARVTGTAEIDGNAVVARFDTTSGRRLDVRIAIGKDVTYTIAEWKATSQAGSVEIQENLWSGTSS